MSEDTHPDVVVHDHQDVVLDQDVGLAGQDLPPPAPPGLSRRAAALRHQLVDAALARAFWSRRPQAIQELARALVDAAGPEALAEVLSTVRNIGGVARGEELRNLLAAEGSVALSGVPGAGRSSTPP